MTRGDTGRHADLFRRGIIRRALLIRQVIVAYHRSINTSDWQKQLTRKTAESTQPDRILDSHEVHCVERR